ncbi:hypothetical protein D1AOALGA4SA_9059 [Olavius algarvensis Delta 1 endosymbiont]|nr:hypothetical protein D1AOALGA4SA_9059 [Olavius algarvensis Delta 1 endosymbiont]
MVLCFDLNRRYAHLRLTKIQALTRKFSNQLNFGWNHPAHSTQNQVPVPWYPASGIWYPISSIQHPVSSIQYPASSI